MERLAANRKYLSTICSGVATLIRTIHADDSAPDIDAILHGRKVLSPREPFGVADMTLSRRTVRACRNSNIKSDSAPV